MAHLHGILALGCQKYLLNIKKWIIHFSVNKEPQKWK